jgi:hypothetical protein
MLIAFISLPSFVIMVFRGMPTVWRGRHRLIFCWLIFMQAVHPGCKTLAEMAKWAPATITARRFGRLLKAAYWKNVGVSVSPRAWRAGKSRDTEHCQSSCGRFGPGTPHEPLSPRGDILLQQNDEVSSYRRTIQHGVWLPPPHTACEPPAAPARR